jgi:PAS domain S-box-containing protein
MKDFRYDDPGLFEAFLKSAQYLVGIKSRRDVWEHLGRLIANHFPAHWTAFARIGDKNEISILHGTLADEDIARLSLDETARAMVADVLDCGFPATKILPVPVPSMTAALPIIERNQPQMVLLIGHRSLDPVPKDLLNIYLAAAGLAGECFERLHNEEELNRYHAQLEVLVKERTAELAKTKRQNELILHSVGEGICGLDLDGNITFVNPSGAKLVGWNPDELIGRNAHAAFHHTRTGGCAYPVEECPVHKAMAKGDARNVAGEEFLRKDGLPFPVELTTSPMVEEGRVVGAVMTFRDITERKAAEEKILKLSEEAQAANQAKSIFLANMSHEIRTPMNGIMGMTELALMKTNEPRVKEFLGYVKQSALHLLDIINDVLDLARIEAGKVELSREQFSLRDLLASVHEPFRSGFAEKGLGLESEIDPAIPERLVGDPGRIRQILTNLIGNALKFTEKGKVSTSVGLAGAGEAENRLILQFEVRDTGIGIPPDQVGIIFKSFEQVHTSLHTKYGGVGLGLTICRELAELMGGEIRVESREGAGSKFSFTAVLETAPMEEKEREKPSRSRRAAAPLKILVAEDSRVNQIFIETLLKKEGHSVTVVETGRQVLDKLAECGFDVVLMDIRMPDMNGDETVRVIRKNPPPGVNCKIPVIALTAYALQSERERYMESGFDAYLTKPVEIEKLQAILGDLQCAIDG